MIEPTDSLEGLKVVQNKPCGRRRFDGSVMIYYEIDRMILLVIITDP